jgi:hypothetical protein
MFGEGSGAQTFSVHGALTVLLGQKKYLTLPFTKQLSPNNLITSFCSLDHAFSNYDKIKPTKCIFKVR